MRLFYYIEKGAARLAPEQRETKGTPPPFRFGNGAYAAGPEVGFF